jgi:transcriptional regulator with XRE-family HTH domain
VADARRTERADLDAENESNPKREDVQLAAFGRRLRELRTASGQSQEALAHKAGLHRAVVGFIERGEREIGISKLWPLAQALDVDVVELVRGLGTATPD